ncbi:single-stranded-DNA-specific exonuclease RecJ [bacterium (Candidatus Blackallbacteria) CG17_big_fil_post_rev_8_21_14_2_50_48_46]|uniref:Single-stranded-DNA-specific exonuclease RecJ n=1 Tax=bacterium (Candidatus Blackallbacteria) CG17_big_fil_post_rev_8_21_14_2_50_48_46 TaxID=2014261 RepID=A0A2M7G997_9BACT|nr:MAG: single-stranded-DNA-specific exonuclease RecJ [bacterium (Candidatus Blackallbacteria) CG18_big_fil_WC_8_21_14_2_50_49_26]PIW18424.1 MAG: single-stranded-DNA-specific exonuclease RecJ [bacterium (Candidatus Blackallbacteria) CG17_big_fil_post_rev_8_21_14_2_50_48_46]PIW46591.1 MAG: single-stranded-DNA-specific exonuclease RecJ [bacterium (Candidatus Blackallbacteria) CG13_big_fil_rev_8_21_14_2_50_49_14]
MGSEWSDPQVPSYHAAGEKLAQDLNISPFLAQLLLNRGLATESEIKAFIQPEPCLEWVNAPFHAALVELFQAVLAQEQLVVIHGDYDADGLTGTAILTEFLRACGFQVEPFLPTRSLGYGLNAQTIERFIESGAKLLITVDCGVSNLNEIAQAKAAGMHTLITDHHGLGETLPPADFILHPQVLGFKELENLSGVGMAYWLMQALHPHFQCPYPPEHWLELAGIGTLADMTPLLGFNRNLVKQSLASIRKTRRPGLLALLQRKNLRPQDLDETQLAFKLIPVLNAAGRLQSPMLSLDLLLAEDQEEADALAETLDHINDARKTMCQELFAEIQAEVSENLPSGPLILAHENWPFGILGILCSQLVEAYGVPVFLISIEKGIGKASVRAPEGFHVLQALQTCPELFLKFGGHAQAGGFSLLPENISALRVQMQTLYLAAGAPVSQLQAEMELNPLLIKPGLWQDLTKLAPFGAGNPMPAFLSLNARLEQIKPDKNRKHLFAEIAPGVRIKAWNAWQEDLAGYQHFDLYYQLEENLWNGRSRLELNVQKIRPRKSVPANLTVPAQKPTQRLLSGHALQAFSLTPPGAEWALNFELPPLDGKLPELIWHDWRNLKKQSQALNKLLAHSETLVLSLPPDLRDQDICAEKTSPVCKALVLRFWPEKPAELRALLIITGANALYLLGPEQGVQAPDFNLLLSARELLRECPIERVEMRLMEALKISYFRATLIISCLCDLGMMAYDKERVKIEKLAQCLSLNTSPHYRAYLSRSEQLLAWNQTWCQRPLAALQKLLHTEKDDYESHT